MPTIKILPQNVANKIAAGEVVERPAAIVKELVENSLDAGAKDIAVRFSHGGRFYIVVEDDGIGMSKDEVLVAIKRHATSKLTNIDDLDNLLSFGFRGEAIPSIASVSQMTVSTKRHDDSVGTKVKIIGGDVVSVQDVMQQTGTKIVVENLFFNVPARRKFLKSDDTEGGHIVSVVKNFSLVENDIKFSLFRDDDAIFSSPQNCDIGSRMNAIFGYCEKFINFSHCDDKISVSGAICSPDFGNICKKNISVFINGRIVRSDIINSVVCEAVRGKYPMHRGILACIFLKIDPALVDVNVHPMKMEVRFKNEVMIREFMKCAMDNLFLTSCDLNLTTRTGNDNQCDVFQKKPCATIVPKQPSIVHDQKNRIAQSFFYEKNNDPRASQSQTYIKIAEQCQLPDVAEPSKNGWKFIGHAYDDVFLFMSDTGVIFFDAKSAISRIVFEKMMSSCQPVEKQDLLFPIEFSVSVQEKERLERVIPVFCEIGFSIYSFGNFDYKVDAIPSWMSLENAQSAIFSVLNGEAGLQCYDSVGTKTKSLMAKEVSNFANIDCNMQERDIDDIKNRLMLCDNPLISPTGRAIYFEFAKCSISNRLNAARGQQTV